MKNNKKGFTLIELLVVIAIIGLLSTLAVVSLNSARTKARDARRMSDLKQISTAVELFSAQNSSGTYPAGSADCSTGVTNTGTNVICAGNAVADGTDTFLSSIPDDPDGTSHYTYDRVDDNNYCIIHGEPNFPSVCRNFKFDPEFCGKTNEEAFYYLSDLEKLTS